MMTLRKKTIDTASFAVSVSKRDIEEGKCGLSSKCMHKVAIERALRSLDPKGGDHRTKVDGGKIRFNLNGYRYEAMPPKIVKTTLIKYDQERKARAKAERAGLKFESKVNPVKYRIEATRKSKIEPFTRERQEQINEARRRRAAAGKPDEKRYDLRFRVEGMGTV
jgi:hypothetical protein